jgi:hypothetical protein
MLNNGRTTEFVIQKSYVPIFKEILGKELFVHQSFDPSRPMDPTASALVISSFKKPFTTRVGNIIANSRMAVVRQFYENLLHQMGSFTDEENEQQLVTAMDNEQRLPGITEIDVEYRLPGDTEMAEEQQMSGVSDDTTSSTTSSATEETVQSNTRTDDDETNTEDETLSIEAERSISTEDLQELVVEPFPERSEQEDYPLSVASSRDQRKRIPTNSRRRQEENMDMAMDIDHPLRTYETMDWHNSSSFRTMSYQTSSREQRNPSNTSTERIVTEFDDIDVENMASRQ